MLDWGWKHLGRKSLARFALPLLISLSAGGTFLPMVEVLVPRLADPESQKVGQIFGLVYQLSKTPLLDVMSNFCSWLSVISPSGNHPLQFPHVLKPFSPVQRHRKFSAVFGTRSVKSSPYPLPKCSVIVEVMKHIGKTWVPLLKF